MSHHLIWACTYLGVAKMGTLLVLCDHFFCVYKCVLHNYTKQTIIKSW